MSSRQPASKTGRSPQWSPPWPTSAPGPIAGLMPRTKRSPGPTPNLNASLRLSPRPRSSRFPRFGPRPRTRPGLRQSPPARPDPPSRSPGQRSPTCQCGGVTLAAWRPLPSQLPSSSPLSSSRSASAGHRRSHRGNPPSCHRCGQGLRRRSRDRASDSPPDRRELDLRSDRARPQATSRQRRLRVLVGRPGSTWPRAPGATGGSFVVGNSGSATLTMTTGVDPRQFRTMEITAEPPGNGALNGAVLLTGQTL